MAAFPDLRGPVGLVLAGGGALGAWQAGCLAELREAGLCFDRILGFSAGAMAGATYAFGRMADLVEFYRDVDRRRLLRFRPALRPPSLFSGEVLWELLGDLQDDAKAKSALLCELTVMTLRVSDRSTVYGRFSPGGKAGWDGPLAPRLVASCAIPLVFPPVRLPGPDGAGWHVDGGVLGVEPMSMACLADCRDVLVLEMVRPDEPLISSWSPAQYIKLRGRRLCRYQVDSAVASARASADPPRIRRLWPSKALDFSMLGFSCRNCGPALDLGRRDASAFLADPAAWEAGGPAAR